MEQIFNKNTGNTSSLWTLIALALSMFMASVSVSITNVALPTLMKVFGVSFSEVQWLTLIYLLIITLFSVSMGQLGDMWGRRHVMLTGVTIFVIGAGAGATALNFGMLIAARACQGIGAASLMALTMATLSDAVAKEKAGSAMGLVGATSAIGTAFGPSLGGVLISFAGWRSVFFFMSAIGIINAVLFYLFLPKIPHPARITENGEVGQIFRNRKLVLNLVTNILVSAIMMTTLIVGPFYLSQILGLNATCVGLVMSVGPTMSILSGLPAGRLVDRYGSPLITIMGLGQMLLGTAALAVLPSFFGLIGYVVSVAFLSPGYQLYQAANNTAVMSDVVDEQRGVVSGLLSLSRNLGLISGAFVMGALFNSIGMGVFVFAAGLAVVALFIQSRIKRPH